MEPKGVGVKLIPHIRDRAALCGIMSGPTSGRRFETAWLIGGSLMETLNLPAIRILRPAWSKSRIADRQQPQKPKRVRANEQVQGLFAV